MLVCHLKYLVAVIQYDYSNTCRINSLLCCDFSLFEVAWECLEHVGEFSDHVGFGFRGVAERQLDGWYGRPLRYVCLTGRLASRSTSPGSRRCFIPHFLT